MFLLELIILESSKKNHNFCFFLPDPQTSLQICRSSLKMSLSIRLSVTSIISWIVGLETFVLVAMIRVLAALEFAFIATLGELSSLFWSDQLLDGFSFLYFGLFILF